MYSYTNYLKIIINSSKISLNQRSYQTKDGNYLNITINSNKMDLFKSTIELSN